MNVLNKSEEKMDYLNFYDYDSFICAVVEQCYNIRNNENSITIIAKYDDARKIIMELVKKDRKSVV